MANADLKQAGHKQAVFLTEEAQGVTLQRTRCIGWGLGAGFNYIMRLQSWSQGEIIYANFVARMYVTAIGERGVGYSNHAGTRLFAADDIFTPNLLAATVHTMSACSTPARCSGVSGGARSAGCTHWGLSTVRGSHAAA